MIYRGLQTGGVFACRCDVQPQWVEVGILIVEDEAFNQVIDRPLRLVATDNPEQSFEVHLPRLNAFVTTKIRLNRV